MNARKTFKSLKTIKERRNAVKTLEKKRRRERPPIDVTYYNDEPDFLKPRPPKPRSLKSIHPTENITPSVEKTPLNLKEFAEYTHFGDSRRFCYLNDNKTLSTVSVSDSDHYLSSLITTIDLTIDEVPKSSALACLPVSLIPMLSFHASQNAKTVQFLQQEIDVLSLLSFSGHVLDNIPTLFYDRYGIDIVLPVGMTPETMLLLSRHVYLYEYMDTVKCALKSTTEYTYRNKDRILFFAKQEFQLLSILGIMDGGDGLSLDRLDYLFVEKYHKNIELPAEEGLGEMLVRSGRVSVQFSEGDKAKYQFVPYLFL